MISRKDIDKLYTNHILHSLAIAKVIEFKKRILNSIDDEFNEAVVQVGKIVNLRLNELNLK